MMGSNEIKPLIRLCCRYISHVLFNKLYFLYAGVSGKVQRKPPGDHQLPHGESTPDTSDKFASINIVQEGSMFHTTLSFVHFGILF